MNFEQRMNRRADQVDDGLVRQQREVMKKVGTVGVLTTPRDTGEAGSGWEISEGAPNGGDGGRIESVSGAISRIEREADALTGSGTAYAANRVGHIHPLENGHSRQAPAGMTPKMRQAARGVPSVEIFIG